MTSPFLLSQPLQPPDTNVVLVSPPILVGEVCQLHPVNDHGRPEPGTEAQEEHPAPFVAPERLHGRVIDNFDRTAECLAEIKSNPAAAEIVGFTHRTSVDHRSRITDRDYVILPILHDTLYISHHS